MANPSLVFATNNAHKIREITEMLENQLQFRSLSDIGCTEELPETQSTIEGNAKQKARYVWEHYQVDCFAEDTGLEVDALHGEPGVYTARYAGASRDPQANMAKVLGKLTHQPNRSAQFRTVIALFLNNEVHTFEGLVRGQISHELRGTTGFGYDPIFIPEGEDRTFAEMSSAAKAAISHRGRATAKLIAFLRQQYFKS